ncbi:MAG: sensor histidine kinase [Candidatus Paceibacterota bacterium]|jgi:signal transduction histidine kinase|nr:ATP-binding protein [Candidatus Paceibacterota bacterium]
MKNKIQFKISSGLKNLIGRELITDEYIAIFELVKNSYDARATKVTIAFENITDPEKSKIIISDNGKGMNYDDLIDKWLFVAYSAKKEGTEDAGEYRDKINSKRLYAGAKGVGRFSCDRLGSELNLITTKNTKNAKTENLFVNWTDFEKDAEKIFAKVDVQHETLKENPYKINHGTVLEICGLRDKWDRKRILSLKRSLAKLINPNQGNDNSKFSIEILASEEKNEDRKQKKERDCVNGYVTNFLFETLGLKTTQIMAEISPDGNIIITTLKDRGRLIYKLTENNPFQGLLTDIKIHLFHLNRKSKANFTKTMGMEPVKYGSIFLYKNGFRIYPFGEDGEDLLGIERRKQQGYNRFLGTRDLMGRIEIDGKNEELKETTSRDGGLMKNKNYEALLKFFNEYALRRLEKYVVDVIKWGDDTKSGQLALEPEDVKTQISDIVAGITSPKGIINLEYDKNFLDIISESQEKSLPKIAKNFARIAEESGNKELQKEAARAVLQVKELLAAKVEAEKGEKNAQELIKSTEQKLEEEISEKLFLKSVLSTDTEEVIVLQHQIDISTEAIKDGVGDLLYMVNHKVPKEKMLEPIERIRFEAEKISSIVKFSTKANFSLQVPEITADLVSFVKEYIENVYREDEAIKTNRPYVIFKVITNGAKFSCKFRPLEVIMVIDNLFSNSMKHNARNITISCTNHNDVLEIKVKDDGTGIEERIFSKVFNLGFTTTDGSGIGLYHVKQIIEKMHGKVEVGRTEKGAEIIIRIKK